MDFYKIKNNTENPLIINGIYIDKNSFATVSDDFLDNVDDKYFKSEILVNMGKELSVGAVHLNPPKNITTVIKERNLEKSVRDSLSRANDIYDLISKIGKENLINVFEQQNKEKSKNIWKEHVESYDQLPDKHSGINANGDLRMVSSTKEIYCWDNSLQSWENVFDKVLEKNKNIKKNKEEDVVFEKLDVSENIFETKSITTIVKEENLDSQVRDALSKARFAYETIENKIGYEQLQANIREIIDSISDTEFKTYWRDPVLSYSLLPDETNPNYNGDIRLVLDTNDFYRWSNAEKSWIKINKIKFPSDTIGQPINMIRERFVIGEFFVREGDQTFYLNGKYDLGKNDLQVILNGLLLVKDEDYIEITERVVQVLFQLQENDYVVFTVSGQENVPQIVVEKHSIEDNTTNFIVLDSAIGNNPSVVQVYLNGMLLSYGEFNDYLFQDNRKIMFNYFLEKDSIVVVRFEKSSLADNVEIQLSQMKRAYFDLSKQIQFLREYIER